MPLSAGVINPTEINTEFNAYNSAIAAVNSARAGDFSYTLDAPGLGSTIASTILNRTYTFRPPDDLEIITLVISAFAPDTNSRSVTATLTSVEDVPGRIYLEGQTVQAFAATTGTTEVTARVSFDQASGTKLFLVKGVQYTLTLAPSIGAFTAFTRVYATLDVRSRKRR